MTFRLNHKAIPSNFPEVVFLSAVFSLMPVFCSADVVINEIMYDPDGSDTGREWVEIKNNGYSDVDITGWKFADVVADDTTAKHILYIPPDHGGSGTMTLSANSFAILASDAVAFLGERSGFSGTVIDTTISNFGQQDGRTYYAKLFNKDGVEVDSVSYIISMGANGDGNSLQLSSGAWVAATPTPGATNVSTSNSPPADTNTDSNNSNNNNNNQIATLSVGNAVDRAPVDPQIFAYINGANSAIVGVETIFKGSVFGLDKKPLINARYLWSFGDGILREGQTVSHFWRIPGVYLIVLEVSSGEFNTSNRLKVTVSESKISIAETKDGTDGFVLIRNDSKDDTDISRWAIKTVSKIFYFPTPTIILGGGSVAFANSVTGLMPEADAVELLYPNGSVASQFNKEISETVVANPISVSPPTVKYNQTSLQSDAPKSVSVSVAKTNDDNKSSDDSEGVASSTVIYGGEAGVGKAGVSLDWVFALVGLIGVGGAGVLFSRSNRAVEANLEPNEGVNEGQSVEDKPLTADDFEIVEEKEE